MAPAAKPVGQKSNVLIIVAVVLGVMFVTALCVIGLLVALMIPAVSKAREAARRTMMQNSGRQIAMALLNYEAAYRTLPAAQISGNDSQPLLSWRVEILPFLDEVPTYEVLQRDQAWDSPINGVLTAKPVKAFTSPLCPDSEGTNRTAFVAVVGPDTVLRPNTPRKLGSIMDGTSNTAMLIELRASDIAWAEPRDVSVDEAVRLIQNCPDSMGLSVILADGSVRLVPPSTSTENLIGMFNCSDGKPLGF
jgi:hypothetical protein